MTNKHSPRIPFRILLLAVVGIMIIGAMLIKRNSHPTNIQTNSQSIIPVNSTWKTRFFDIKYANQSMQGFPEGVFLELTNIPETNLTRLRCSEHFIRNWEAMFFLQDSHTTKFTKSLDHNAMLLFMSKAEKQLPHPQADQKFLLGKVCETEKGDTFFEYHRGKQKQVFDDFFFLGDTIETFIIPADEHFTFEKSIELTDTASGPNYSCMPLQMVNTQLYYSCTELRETEAITWYYRIDMQKKQKVVLDTCTFTYTPSVSRTCTND